MKCLHIRNSYQRIQEREPIQYSDSRKRRNRFR